MKPKHWTDKVRLNAKFLLALTQELEEPEFTNAQAYEVYLKRCARKKTLAVTLPNGKVRRLDDFVKMNVRNQLCKMEHLHILRRLKPGTYEFDYNGFMYTYGEYMDLPTNLLRLMR